jgi:hypothetical protein
MTTFRRRLAALEGSSAPLLKERIRAALHSKFHLSAMGSGGGQGRHRFTYDTDWNGSRVQWTFHFEEGTQTVELEVSAPDTISESELIVFVNEFLVEVLDAALTGITERFAIRRLFTYQGPPLDGEYWLSPFRIAPHEVTEGLRRGSWVSQILVVDQTVDAVDRQHAWAVGSDRASTLAARLSLILDIGLQVPPQEWVWTATDESGSGGAWRYRTAPPEAHFLERLPKQGLESGPGEWTGNLHSSRDGGRKLSLPRETRRVLRFADTAPEPIRKAFDGCCRLYQLSNVLPHEFVSARLALRVAAAEAVAKVAEPSQSFAAFMRSRSPLIQAHPELLDILYKDLRSGLFHAGHLHLNDRIRLDDFADFDAALRRNEEARGEAALRDAIIVWVRSNLENES